MPKRRGEKEKSTAYTVLFWSWLTDLNPRPADYKSAALPTELNQRMQFYNEDYYSKTLAVCQGKQRKGIFDYNFVTIIDMPKSE